MRLQQARSSSDIDRLTAESRNDVERARAQMERSRADLSDV